MAAVHEEGSYICDSCGETILIPVDISQGACQDYIEDCPVCCHANRIRVQVDDAGEVIIWAESES
jgi:hypothetical protein